MADIHWGASHRVIISCAADRLTIAVLPVLAALTFGYSTYLSVETENDPVGGAFSLAVYSVFLLSTVSIIYAQSLRDEWSRERRKIGLCVVISLYCVIAVAFFARVSAVLPRPAYCLLLGPWLLPVSIALAFCFLRRSILSSLPDQAIESTLLPQLDFHRPFSSLT